MGMGCFRICCAVYSDLGVEQEGGGVVAEPQGALYVGGAIIVPQGGVYVGGVISVLGSVGCADVGSQQEEDKEERVYRVSFVVLKLM